MATNTKDSHGSRTLAPSSLRLRIAEARRASNSQGADFETQSSSLSEMMERRRRPNKLEHKPVPVPLKKRYTMSDEVSPHPHPYTSPYPNSYPDRAPRRPPRT